jgi:hypothetical protein
MPPSLRRRAQPGPSSPQFAEPPSDSDEDVGEVGEVDVEGDDLPADEEASALEAEEDDAMGELKISARHDDLCSNKRP